MNKYMLSYLKRQLLQSSVLGPIILVVIGVWGLFLRVYKLGAQSLWIDEGFSISAARAVLEHGYPLLPSGFVARLDLLPTYAIALFTGLFGFDPFSAWSARLPGALASAGVIILIFYITYYLFEKRYVAFLAVGFFAISYWDIAWARQARMYAFLQFFFFLALFFLFRFLKKQSPRDFFGIIFATVGAVLSHRQGLILLPYFFSVAMVAAVAVYLNKKMYQIPYPSQIGENWHRYINWYRKHPSLNAILTVLLLLLLVSFIREGFIWARSGFGMKAFVVQSFQAYLWETRKWLILGALVGAIFALLRTGKIARIFMAVFAYLVPFEAIAFTAWRQEFRYIFFFTPVLFIFAAYACESIGALLKKRYLAYLVSFSLFLVLLWRMPIVLIPRSYFNLETGVPQPDFKSAYEFLGKGVKSDDLIISPLPVMDNLYLNRSDYSILISLTANDRDLEYKVGKDGEKYDLYTNTPTLEGVADLKKAINGRHGFVLVDEFSMSGRVPQDIAEYITKRMVLIWKKDDGFWKRIFIYQF